MATMKITPTPSTATLTLIVEFDVPEEAYDNAKTIVEDASSYGAILTASLSTPPVPATVVDLKEELWV